MAKRKGWMSGPVKSPKPLMPDSIKSELEAEASDLIENVLKPKYIVTPNDDVPFNYITDNGAKWNGSYFYFVATYACPGPNAISPTFESNFARMEYVGGGKFALSFMRHNGKWVGLYECVSLSECLKAIRDDAWFQP